MSIHLNTKTVANSAAVDVHLLGFNIEHTGDAKVSEFFKTTIRETNGDSNITSVKGQDLTSTFRGRLLCGQVLDVPHGYTGLVLTEHQKPFMEEEDRTFQATHKFDKFSYWNLEQTPSANDAVVKAMMWPEIADAIHRSEDDKESQESVKGET